VDLADGEDMKKIVYVSNANIPSESASSVHVMKMCEAFQQNDVDIILVIPNHFNKEKYKDVDVFGFYGVKNKFKIKRVKFIRKNVKGIHEILYTIAAVFYTKFIKRPDIMMTRKIMAARVAAMVHMPYILELHSATEPTHYSLEKTLHSRYMKKLVTISGTLKDYMTDKYALREDQVLVLADAVDLSAYEKLDTTLQFHEERLKIAYVGSLYPGKGIETIVRLAAMDKTNQYDIYGARGPLDKWQKLKEELHSNVNFMGQIANANVPGTLIQYDVLLMPYSDKVEVYGDDLTNWMSPLKMFEYMASGRVIVSSDLPVIREILKDRENAYLVAGGKVENWKTAIDEISADRETAGKIAAQAKVDVKQYTWLARAGMICNIL
jgi:glycosyltransferase involved in cell wall biosynthesis